MEITSASAASSTAVTSSSATVSSDFETFLKMLTAQMQNQDPLNPIDSADYAVQLATFSSVEQQVLSNDLLTNLNDQIGQMGLTQLAGWVGMEARTEGPAYFDGSPITLVPDVQTGADTARLVVRDASGQTVHTQSFLPGDNSLVWDGSTLTGGIAAQGTYSFIVESLRGDEVVQSSTPEVYAKVTEARSGASGVSLVLAGGIEVASSAVTAVRQAE